MNLSKLSEYILAFSVIMCCMNAMAVSYDKKDLRIMSYNVRNGIGMDDLRDLKRTVSVINDIKPDIVAVQELDSMTRRSGNRYILGELAAASGMNDVYAPAIDYDGGRYGIGLLCRDKPMSVRRVALPGREERRVLLIVEFKKFAVACTHLSLTREDAEASVNIIKEAAEGIKKPLILCGDLNSLPDSKVISEISGFMDRVSDDSFTFPASSPKETLDYIFLKHSGKRKLCKLSYHVVDAPVESDHRPIVADLRLK